MGLIEEVLKSMQGGGYVVERDLDLTVGAIPVKGKVTTTRKLK